MTAYAALLRAVNVGGTGKLAMSDLIALCETAGFARVTTYIASGNVVFESDLGEVEVKAALEARLADHAGKPVGALVRTAAELARVAADNPFPDAPANRVLAIFLNARPPPDAAEAARNRTVETIALGAREIYVDYGEIGMGLSRLIIPAAKEGTGRNINTVRKLAAMTAAL